MKEDRVKEAAGEYVRERLREEIARSKRGTAARLARELDISTAHMSNITSERPTRSVGEDVRRRAAALWGMSLEQLEAIATGRQRDLIYDDGERMHPNLAEAVAWVRAKSAAVPFLEEGIADVARERRKGGFEDALPAELAEAIVKAARTHQGKGRAELAAHADHLDAPGPGTPRARRGKPVKPGK